MLTSGEALTLPSPEGSWAEAEAGYATEQNLRILIEQVGFEYDYTCRDDWNLYRHKETGAKKLMPLCCRHRGHCPHCGRTYGESQGIELHTVILAALERRRQPVRHGDVLAWAPVVTLPPQVNDLLAALASEGYRRHLSKMLSRIQEVIRDAIATEIFVTHPKQVTASVNWHYWHSARPLDGYHFHAHVLIPNVTEKAAELSAYREIPEHRLEAFKRAFFEGLEKLFPTEMEEFSERWKDWPGEAWEHLNFHVRWYQDTDEGHAKLKHRCRYDARHPMADLTKYLRLNPEAFNDETAVRDFLMRSMFFQQMKTRRYFGHLVPGRRKRYGIVRVEPDGDNPWQLVRIYHRKLVRFVDRGVILRFWDNTFERYEFLPSHEVQLSLGPPAKRYEYRPPQEDG